MGNGNIQVALKAKFEVPDNTKIQCGVKVACDKSIGLCDQ